MRQGISFYMIIQFFLFKENLLRNILVVTVTLEEFQHPKNFVQFILLINLFLLV